MKQVLLIATISVLVLSACDKHEIPKSPAASIATIEAGTANSSVPVQLQVVGHYNIVKYRGKFYACPHGQEVNWEKDDVAKLPGVVVADSQDGVIVMLPR